MASFILEDAAHALEAKSNNIKVGNTNYAAAFSFYAKRILLLQGKVVLYQQIINNLHKK